MGRLVLKVWNGEFGVESLERGVGSLESGIWSGKYGVGSL